MKTGDRALWVILGGILTVGLTSGFPAAAEKTEHLSGYAEWRRGAEVIVDGQRLRAGPQTAWKGKFNALSAVPLGYEVRADGTREPDGVLIATEIDVRPNGKALFESDVQQGTDALEGLWLQGGEAFEGDQYGRKLVIGEVHKEGREVERVRRLVRRVAPPYVDHSRMRGWPWPRIRSPTCAPTTSTSSTACSADW